MKADLDLRKVFFQQVVLAGGSTLFPGKPLQHITLFMEKVYKII
jgi:actin-related protein